MLGLGPQPAPNPVPDPARGGGLSSGGRGITDDRAHRPRNCTEQHEKHTGRRDAERSWAELESLDINLKPYEFIRFGDIHGPKPYECIGFGDIHGTKPYNLIRVGDIHGHEPYKFMN